MATPLHQYASVPVDGQATTVQQALRAHAAESVRSATAAGLARLQPLVSLWGLTPTELPSTDTRPTGDDEIGTVAVRWSGDEEATAWPSMTARLLVVPDEKHVSRLVLLSQRSFGAELGTARLGRVHRQRLVAMAVQRFLGDLVDDLGGNPAVTAGTGALAFDPRPMFVHHLRHVDEDPHHLASQLRTHVSALAGHATRDAVDRAHPALAAGRFRLPAAPQVDAWSSRPGHVATVCVTWKSDEEATGWPDLTLGLVVEALEDGSRLAVTSTRPPGHDLTRNRVDKHTRHDLRQHAGAHLAEALLDRLGHTKPPSAASELREPVAASA